MKSRITCIRVASLFTLVLILSIAAFAHDGDGRCSTARVAGNWSLTDNGTVVGIGPRTAVGVMTLDAAGNISNGSATSSLNGSIAAETFSGTYTVNSDCSGTISVNIYSGGVELFTIKGNTAFDQDVRHMRGVFTSVTEPDGTALATVISLDANKQ